MNRPHPGGCLPPRAVAPHTPPPLPDEWGGHTRRIEGLLSQADEILLKAEFDTDTVGNLGAASTSRVETDGASRVSFQDGEPMDDESSSSALKNQLCALYASEALKETRSSNLKLASNLLDRLMGSSPVTRLVLTLHQPQDGYVLGICDSNHTYSEIVKFSYQDTYLLNCIDLEEIPVILTDLLQDLSEDLFHCGCIVCEVRDNRSANFQGGGGVGLGTAGGGTARGRYVLLRPSTQSIICDSQKLGRDSLGRITSEERNSIESQIVLATESPLCLDPSPLVGLVANKADHSRLKFNTVPLRRHAHKNYSQAGQNRKRKLESLPAPPELKIYDFIKNLNTTRLSTSSKSKRRLTPIESLRQHQERSKAIARDTEAMMAGRYQPSCVKGSLHLADPDLRLAMPAQVDVENHVRPLTRRPDNITDMTPQLVEEYILETAERGPARVYHTRLTILKRKANEEFLGELYVERDYKEDEKKGSTCRFQLGTRTDALKYINQFTEIFTEEGRKSVKITHKVPGQPPRLTYTPGLKEAAAAAALAQGAQQQSTAVAAAAAPAQQPAVAAGQQQQQAAAQPAPQASILQRKVTPSSTHLTINSQGGINVLRSVGGGTITVSSATPTELVAQAQVVTTVVTTLAPQPGTSQAVVGVVGQTTPTKNQLNTILASKISRQFVQTPHGPQLIHTPIQTKPKTSSAVPHQTIQIQQHPPTAAAALAAATAVKTASAAQAGASPANGDNNQQEAISAIVQSLMSAEAQFEQRKLEERKQPVAGTATVMVSTAATAAAGGGGAAQLLPTVPVPASSLVGQRLPSGRVTVHNLRTLPLQQQQVKVTLSQLAAQLARPVQTSVALPSYSQAIASQINPSTLQTSPQKRDQPQSSPADPGQATPSLQALLSDEKPAVSSISTLSSTPMSNATLLERLMAGSNSTSNNSVNSPNLNPLAGQLPTVVAPQAGGTLNGAVAGVDAASNDITLAGLLSNPPKSGQSGASGGSPTKMSPLLQQLQQPVQPVHSRMYQTAGLTSPKHPPASPRTNVTSPRSIQPAQSPRAVVPGSPRQGGASTPHPPQLMQPPAPRYPAATTHSILSAQLSQPPRSNTVSNILHGNQSLMAVTSQGLVPVSNQQNLVTVTQGQLVGVGSPQVVQGSPQVVQVSQAGVLGATGQTQHVLQVSGGGGGQSQPSMVSVSLQDLVNSGNAGTTINGTVSHGGIVTLGGVGQVQLVNQSIPVQLSIPGHNQPITFSVSLPEGHQGVSNGAVNQQMIVSGVNNTAKSATVGAGGGAGGAVSVSSVGKLVNGPAGTGTVVLQGPGGNIIHLPPSQQQTQPAGAQYTSIKPAPLAAVQSNMNVVRTNQVMVRPAGQPNSLLVQVPSGVNQQNIQIVRPLSVNQQLNCGTLVQAVPSQVKGVGASPSPQGPATPQTPGIPPSPVSVTSPQGIITPESPMVMQIQNHGGSDHHFVLSNQKQGGGLVAQPLGAAGQIINNQTLNSQSHLKIRQQRKQSLK